MRRSATGIGNLLGWAVLLVLAAAAVGLAVIWGFAALLLLGLLTWFVCTAVSLNDQTPSWGTAVFRARMEQARTPEERAAEHERRASLLSEPRFYARCGMLLTAVGAAGLAWEAWR